MRVNTLPRLFHPPFLSCPPLQPSPPSPPLFNPTADDATTSSPHGSDARVLPEPHGGHRCRANAANGSFQRQRAGGYSHDTVLRYAYGCSTPTGGLNDFTDARAGAPLSISHCWPGTFSSLVRIIEAARNIFIKGLSAPALVTFLRCGLHLQKRQT